MPEKKIKMMKKIVFNINFFKLNDTQRLAATLSRKQ
jgi:hypothetical protein